MGQGSALIDNILCSGLEKFFSALPAAGGWPLVEADDDESEDETKLIILIIGAISDLRAAAAGRGEQGVSRYHRVARARIERAECQNIQTMQCCRGMLWVMY